MTRINTIPPQDLTDQHLLAEYRELPRIFRLARPAPKAPKHYTLGRGHVLFFYARTRYLAERQARIIRECLDRGFRIQHTMPPEPVQGLDQDWAPTERDRRVNLERLRERLWARPGWYTYGGEPVGADFYGGEA